MKETPQSTLRSHRKIGAVNGQWDAKNGVPPLPPLYYFVDNKVLSQKDFQRPKKTNNLQPDVVGRTRQKHHSWGIFLRISANQIGPRRLRIPTQKQQRPELNAQAAAGGLLGLD
jgi:hypothetical protein